MKNKFIFYAKVVQSHSRQIFLKYFSISPSPLEDRTTAFSFIYCSSASGALCIRMQTFVYATESYVFLIKDVIKLCASI